MDMETEQNIYLKNVTQIGTPGRSGKIYISDEAYTRIHMDEFRDMRVFVLMGHTECSSGKYTTFVEAVIPIEDISFIRGTPVWTNKVWNRVYQEIKRTWESMIIVGWALDRKGIFPKMNDDLESAHREHFGGANQVLFLLDTEAQEEVFYLSKNNHLCAKDGFYIYYGVNRKKEKNPELSLEIPPEAKTSVSRGSRYSSDPRDFSRKVRDEDYYTDAEDAWDMNASYKVTMKEPQDIKEDAASDAQRYSDNYRKKDSDGETEGSRRGSAREQYRQMMESGYGRRRKGGRRNNAMAAVIALMLIAGIAWTALKRNPESAARLNEFIETISNGVSGNADNDQEDADYVIRFSTETNDAAEQSGLRDTGSDETQESALDEQQEDTQEASGDDNNTETETASVSKEVIPIEEVDGGIEQSQSGNY